MSDKPTRDDWETYFTAIKEFAADVIRRVDAVSGNPAFQKCEKVLSQDEKTEIMFKKLRGEMSLVEVEAEDALEQIENSKKKQKGE